MGDVSFDENDFNIDDLNLDDFIDGENKNDSLFKEWNQEKQTRNMKKELQNEDIQKQLVNFRFNEDSGFEEESPYNNNISTGEFKDIENAELSGPSEISSINKKADSQMLIEENLQPELKKEPSEDKKDQD